MLKRNKIYQMICMEGEEDNQEASSAPSCTWQWVTNATKVKDCEDTCQAIIDAIDIQIEEYEAQRDEIDGKKGLAEGLEASFDGCQDAINNAHLNATELNGCEDCIVGLQATFDEMLAKCDEKLEELRLAREELVQKKAACATSSANKDYVCR